MRDNDNEFIPRDEAIALKTLGFDEGCIMMYSKQGGDSLWQHASGGFNAPLYQQAFRWFRDVHELHSPILCMLGHYTFTIHRDARSESLFTLGVFNGTRDHGECELWALRKLIEIVKDEST